MNVRELLQEMCQFKFRSFLHVFNHNVLLGNGTVHIASVVQLSNCWL